ncbi:MAG: lipopolysaccharide biosynthesis protein [Myxococcales bacterium]|nr:lipopolysaccharide biosynthesis protein [Myxococcales bacterium]
MAEPSTPPEAFGSQIRSGFKWTGAELVLRLAIRIAALAFLARHLLPVDFGVFAAAMTAWELLRPFSTLCMEQALIQRKKLTEGDVGVACGIASGTCAIATVILVFGAGAIRFVYEDPRVEQVLFVLAFSLPFHCASMLTLSALRRRLAFRPLSIIALCAAVLGAVVSVLAALNGAGVWSLVFGHYVEVALPGLLALYLLRDELRWPRFWGQWRPLTRFGAGQTLALFLNYWALHGDYVIIGRYLGSRPLGFYSRAYQLMSVAPNLFGSLHATVLFPGLSRIQSDPKRMASAVHDGVEVIATLTLPASAFAIVAAPELVRLVLGPGWDPVVPPFQVLAAGIYLRTAYRLMASVILATGHVFRLAVCQGVYAALVVGGSLYALQWGIAGVAGATLLALIVFYALLTIVAMRIASVPTLAFFLAHLRGGAVLMVALACGWSVRQIMPVDVASPLVFLGTYPALVLLVLALLTFRFKERLWGKLLYDLGRRAYLKSVRH